MAKSFIKWMDELPLVLQIIFCIPMLDIVWAIYRIVKGAIKEDPIILVAGVLWIVPGVVIGWICDLVTTILWQKRILA